MAYGDPVIFVYKGESYEIPHNRTLFALQRVTKEDKSKNEPALDIKALESGDVFELSIAVHRALTFAGASIDDPLDVVHVMNSEEGEGLGVSLAELFNKIQPPGDLKSTKKKTVTRKASKRASK